MVPLSTIRVDSRKCKMVSSRGNRPAKDLPAKSRLQAQLAVFHQRINNRIKFPLQQVDRHSTKHTTMSSSTSFPGPPPQKCATHGRTTQPQHPASKSPSMRHRRSSHSWQCAAQRVSRRFKTNGGSESVRPTSLPFLQRQADDIAKRASTYFSSSSRSSSCSSPPSLLCRK
jgi:hypothetical protein